MRIFAIRDEHDSAQGDVAYLFYYELEKKFYIELPDDAESWNTPLILESILRRGSKTVDSYWSRVWVQQRIIPSDRQNIGQILKENGLDSYDEFELLLRSEGRCAQDNYYIAEISESELPDNLLQRVEHRLEDALPLSGMRILAFFHNGETKVCELKEVLARSRKFEPVMRNREIFDNVKIQTAGFGISWGEQLMISYDLLYQIGEALPLSQDDFSGFVKRRVVTTAEAAELLQCTKQNIEDLTRRGKLHPLKETAKGKLFLRSEIERRLWR